MKINKQRLIISFLLFYLPLMLSFSSLELFDNFILFIVIFALLMLMFAILSIFKNKSSRIKYLYDNVMGSKNAPIDRSPIIFWSCMIFFVLTLSLFIISGWLFSNIGLLALFSISYGLGIFIQCVTFNFEK
ncbi:hypothetical protein DY138_06070 [Apilactobacillus timberlakei]|uniref:hypothetical protein n=1 Tax=Apilactobacillus timberlakei TaxID=2008380 RepID=UPI0011260EF5|nr:hypothetical protein [Apilactobacillus timberlakei]TPR18046.1 hypothetical protein DY138_06070 [Apilactobacillus timberlakei]TPR19848.1 hypothetical protein DY061_05975 [Apilactobacillus timberlakei]TPR21386.1 hypothetical protein DY083_06470 [Apilactobacillus timberlakei]